MERAPTSRGYSGDADLAAMQALVRDAWAAHGPHAECAVGDLDWRRYRSQAVDPCADIRLWAVGGVLVGFAWSYGNGDLDVVVFPRAHCAAVVPEMVAWGEARAGPPGASPDRRFTAWALASNAPLSRALGDAGLRAGDRAYLHLFARLDGLALAPEVPPGYTVRRVAGPSEAAARAAVHRAAFGSNRFTTAACEDLMRDARCYRADFDVVAVAPDGELAAFALGWLDPDNRLAELEPVGTAPAHRRRGLARAVSQEALRRMRAAGARDAMIAAQSGHAASLATYVGLGLREVDRNVGFSRA